ncbi:MAG TPA: tyrosine-type recombinase/integrase [Pseudonocardiaceae bacterium]
MGRPTSKVTKVVVKGPLAPFADAYRSRLEDFGYTALTTVNELRQIAHLSRWMEAAAVAAAELTTDRLEQFLKSRRARVGDRNCSFQGLGLLLGVLRASGVLVEEAPSAPTSANDVLLASFRRHLRTERGLAECTTDAYAVRAQRFLASCSVEGDLSTVTPADVTKAVRDEAGRVSAGSAQYFVAGLRSFLRFCFLEGLVDAELSGAALAVTGRRHSSLPKGISHAAAIALLRSCDRRRSDGRRDYAILIVLLRLGLRAGEVARLTLDDVNWRAGEITVLGKGRRQDRLPLPAEVGEAIVGYLRRGRPRNTRREVFLRSLAPIGPLGRGGVSCVVRRACRRAGLPEVGAHRLRHTLACEMVAAGVGLPEIGQVLRQCSTSSTAIYARVDLAALRQLALPWPGVEPR